MTDPILSTTIDNISVVVYQQHHKEVFPDWDPSDASQSLPLPTETVYFFLGTTYQPLACDGIDCSECSFDFNSIACYPLFYENHPDIQNLRTTHPELFL